MILEKDLPFLFVAPTASDSKVHSGFNRKFRRQNNGPKWEVGGRIERERERERESELFLQSAFGRELCRAGPTGVATQGLHTSYVASFPVIFPKKGGK